MCCKTEGHQGCGRRILSSLRRRDHLFSDAPLYPRRASCTGRRVMAKSITYVGLDVHKDAIAVALAEAGLRREVREHGKIPNTPAALQALTVKLVPARRELRFCYEIGRASC